ncbi:MAG: hypothetical protein L3K07_08385, partial [Thermoplasmata archaeon]|nr:hypothetical protein [Thermoplasmata archaeon]
MARTKRAAPSSPARRKPTAVPRSTRSERGRRVYMVTGGVTKFAKAHPAMDFRLMVKRAYDQALADVPDLTKDR